MTRCPIKINRELVFTDHALHRITETPFSIDEVIHKFKYAEKVKISNKRQSYKYSTYGSRQDKVVYFYHHHLLYTVREMDEENKYLCITVTYKHKPVKTIKNKKE